MLRFCYSCIIACICTYCWSNPYNIAPKAHVTASSTLSEEYLPANVVDGVIGVDNIGEWAEKGENNYWGHCILPWIKLEWNEEQWINKIILYDRVNRYDHIAAVRVEGSNGFSKVYHGLPNHGLPYVINIPKMKVSWLKFYAVDGDGKNLGFSEIEVYPSPEDYVDYVSWVDPYIETVPTRFFYFITGNQPYGMIGAAPITRNKNQGGGGYNYNSNQVFGFGQLHCWMQSGLNIMPTTGGVDPRKGMLGWASTFSHDDEIVQPGYHRLFLQDYKIWVEQTATERSSFYRYRFTENDSAGVILSLGGKLGSVVMADYDVRVVSKNEIEGSFITKDRLWGGPQNAKVFFVVQLDKPFEDVEAWNHDILLRDSSSFSGEDGGLILNYKMRAGELLQLKVSISFTSIENARDNLLNSCKHWNFDEVRKNSQDEWNDWLGKIEVKGGTDAQKIKFYTNLWHVLLGRHKINDFSGDYPDLTHGKKNLSGPRAQFKYISDFNIKTLPKDKLGRSKFNMYNSDAFWGSQWNLNILWGLAYPHVLDDFAASLIQYDTNGGLLPRGPSMGGYSYIMDGCPATLLITSAFQRSITKKWDIWKGYEAMKRNHGQGGMQSFEISHLQPFYEKCGYVPGRAGFTIQWALEDWALSQMAKSLGQKRDAKHFAKRSLGWRKLFHPQIKLLFPKDEKGQWMSLNPFNGQGFVEASSWQASFGVSHDLKGLSALMGGKDSLCVKLDYAFKQSVVSNFRHSYVDYSNQPGLSTGHVFSHMGQPWKTQYWIRQVCEKTFAGITPYEGYGGMDEDQGQMGALHALMQMGLFCINGGSAQHPSYEITSPIFDEIIIHLDSDYYKGDTFKIKTYSNSSENCYIQQASLNGKPYNSFLIPHDKLTQGGVLELWMGKNPNLSWGVERLD